MASTESPVVGNCVGAAQHQHDRGGSSIDQIRHHRLYGWASTLDREQFDGPRSSLRLSESLRNYLKTGAGTRDTDLDDALANLIGMHDAWKVFDRICHQLQGSVPVDEVPLGDITCDQFSSVLSGNAAEYLTDCGVAPPFQHLLADFYRAHWEPITPLEGEASPQNNATDSGDSQGPGSDMDTSVDAGDSSESAGSQEGV